MARYLSIGHHTVPYRAVQTSCLSAHSHRCFFSRWSGPSPSPGLVPPRSGHTKLPVVRLRLRIRIRLRIPVAAVEPAAGANLRSGGAPAPCPLNEGKPVSGGDLGNLVEVPPGMQDGAPDLGLVAAQKGSRRLAIPPHAPKVEIAAGEFVAETKVQGNFGIVGVGHQALAGFRFGRGAAVRRNEALPPIEVATGEVGVLVELCGDGPHHQVKDEIVQPAQTEIVQVPVHVGPHLRVRFRVGF
mmetsp:Transcript_23575/g.51583  ORF Transcript_23575/g.51583 Transcript_23575/m.51583 type:complete len:242 (-) Transcript_23575:442-1167(-)